MTELAVRLTFYLVAFGWLSVESAMLVARRRAAGAKAAERGSALPIWAGVILSIGLAWTAHLFGVARLPMSTTSAFAAGTSVMLVGIAIRAGAILTLGRFFTLDVMIHHDHQLVTHGLFRRVRHPSYTGLLVGLFGYGLALGTWPSLVALFVPACLLFLRRIRIEERALQESFGEIYDDYRARTKRLLPWIY